MIDISARRLCCDGSVFLISLDVAVFVGRVYFSPVYVLDEVHVVGHTGPVGAVHAYVGADGCSCSHAPTQQMRVRPYIEYPQGSC